MDALMKPVSGRLIAAMAISVAVAPWCSFASVFVIAGCGMTLLVTSLRSGRYRDAAVWGMIGVGWLASFIVCYRASTMLLSPYTTMYRFWDFAFLPVNPLSRGGFTKAGGILLKIFVDPLNLVPPIWPWAFVMLPILLMVFGGVSLARRSIAACSILVVPIALALVASALKRYPFHGRLILELVPALFLLIAEGTEVVHRLATGRVKLCYKVVLVLLLAFPCLSATYRAVETRERYFNPHGDLQDNIFIK